MMQCAGEAIGLDGPTFLKTKNMYGADPNLRQELSAKESMARMAL